MATLSSLTRPRVDKSHRLFGMKHLERIQMSTVPFHLAVVFARHVRLYVTPVQAVFPKAIGSNGDKVCLVSCGYKTVHLIHLTVLSPWSFMVFYDSFYLSASSDSLLITQLHNGSHANWDQGQIDRKVETFHLEGDSEIWVLCDLDGSQKCWCSMPEGHHFFIFVLLLAIYLQPVLFLHYFFPWWITESDKDLNYHMNWLLLSGPLPWSQSWSCLHFQGKQNGIFSVCLSLLCCFVSVEIEVFREEICSMALLAHSGLSWVLCIGFSEAIHNHCGGTGGGSEWSEKRIAQIDL